LTFIVFNKMKFFKRIQKPIAGLVLASTFLLAAPRPAQAIPATVTNFFANIWAKVQTILQGTGNASAAITASQTTLQNVRTVVDKATAEAAGAGIEAAITACDESFDGLELLNILRDFVGQGFSAIAGSGLEAATLAIQTNIVRMQKVCYTRVQLFTRLLPNPVGLEIWEVKRASIMNELSQRITNAKARADKLGADQRFSVKEMLKAIMLGILYNLTQKYAAQFVNQLVARYKINNFLNYASLLGSQIYAMDYIRTNVKDDPLKQAAMRFMLIGGEKSNNKYLKNAATLIDAAVRKDTGFDPTSLLPEDNQFYSKISRLYKNQFSPRISIFGQVQDAKAVGLAAANNEITTGNGFMAARTCGQTLATQKELDRQMDDLADKTAAILEAKYDLREQRDKVRATPWNGVFEDLQAQEEELMRLDAEIKKADDAYSNISKETLPKVSKAGHFVQKVCESIDKPSNFVESSINSLMDTYIKKGVNYDDKNLPLWAKNLAGHISGIATKFITDGIKGKNVATDFDLGLNDFSSDTPIPNLKPVLSPTVEFRPENLITIEWDNGENQNNTKRLVQLRSGEVIDRNKHLAIMTISYPPTGSFGDLGKVEFIDNTTKQPIPGISPFIPRDDQKQDLYRIEFGPFADRATFEFTVLVYGKRDNKIDDKPSIAPKVFKIVILSPDEFSGDVLGASTSRQEIKLRGEEVVFQ